MCIRDRYIAERDTALERRFFDFDADASAQFDSDYQSTRSCLLYTSDAADERSSVDLGGRRILKKKTNKNKKQTNKKKITTQHMSHHRR